MVDDELRQSHEYIQYDFMTNFPLSSIQVLNVGREGVRNTPFQYKRAYKSMGIRAQEYNVRRFQWKIRARGSVNSDSGRGCERERE